MPRLARYGPGARVYDVVSGERLVYRVGRLAGIDALRLSPGDVVLDLGCGTGLNLPHLIEKVGTDGMVIGIDRSAAMLRVAKEKVARNRWENVRLVEGDVADLSWSDIRQRISTDRDIPHAGSGDSSIPHADSGHSSIPYAGSTDRDTRHLGATDDNPAHVNAALATYAMSVFDDWHPAWKLMQAALAPGGRTAIVDMARPVGFGALLTPLAVLACALGGADLDAAPWRALTATGTDVSHETYRSGHIHVAAGSFP